MEVSDFTFEDNRKYALRVRQGSQLRIIVGEVMECLPPVRADIRMVKIGRHSLTRSDGISTYRSIEHFD